MSIMIDNATKLLEKEGCSYNILRVPGSLELPAALSFTLAVESDKYDGYIILGCIIKGESGHYKHVCRETMNGLSVMSYNHCLAMGIGIITAQSREIAEKRLEDYSKKAVYVSIKMANIKDNLFNNK